MTKKEKDILDKVLETLQGYEDKCWQQMEFLGEHNFNVEREAVSLKQQAYKRCKMELYIAIEKLKVLQKNHEE